MANKCKICLDTYDEPTLEQHVAAQHTDHEESVERVYPDVYETVFVEEAVAPGGDGSEPDDGTDDEEADEPTTLGGGPDGRTDDDSLVTGMGNKWMMIGVGGAGNHILDAVLMRRDTLRERNSSLVSVWEGGLADYGNLNTNISEIEETYYAREDRQLQREALMTNCMIGYQEHNYSGAGRNWQIGRTLMEADFEGEKNAIRDRLDIDLSALEASQAIMLIHSVTKGTGCGATPVLGRNIREMVTQGIGGTSAATISKPILSSVVIPHEDEFGGSEMVRGVVGMAYLSKVVDGIVPFDNSKLNELSEKLAVDIDQATLERYNPPRFTSINRILVTFLEAFTMSSTPQSADTAATSRIKGDVFDVPDSFRPVEMKYPSNTENAYQPAVVMAPVIGKSVASAGSFDESRLDTLARSALLKGQLIDFDPSTAWGGTFMVYGPEEKMEELAPLLNQGKLDDILSGPDFLDRAGHDGGESVDLYVNQLVVPHVEDVYLWGLLWNPHLPSLERMYDHAADLTENSDSRQAETLRDIWDTVEPLFGALGRENMG